MEYQMNLGVWNSVFVVPSAVVDDHLKLAGAAQLKVLLWFLRHAGETVSVNDIAAALTMQEVDVKDSLQYWVHTGVVKISENTILPVQEEKSENHSVIKTVKEENNNSVFEPKPVQNEEPASVPVSEKTEKNKSARALSSPTKPDAKYVAKRIDEDETIRYLMDSAENILGRMTSPDEKATFLMIHESDGLPVDVILMLMQYAAEIGKLNARYIEKTAINWADDEITTLAAAEKKIQQLTNGRNAAKIIQNIFGLDDHSPTPKEINFAERWLNEWKFSKEMLRFAYEICVDATSKYIPTYVNKILSKWYESGIDTLEKAQLDQLSKIKNIKKPTSNDAVYDLDEYDSTSVADEED